MPGSRISNFAAATAITGDDLFLMVDTGSSTTQRITAANAARDLVKLGISVGTAEPSSPYNGQPWVDLNSNPPVLRVWNGATWTVWSTSPTVVVTSPGGSAPSNPATGTLWLDTSSSPNELKVWNGTNWVRPDPDGITQTDADARYLQIATASSTYATLASPTFTGTVGLPAFAYSGTSTTTATSYLAIPRGTDAQRGSPGASDSVIRYNTTSNTFEGWNGTAWSGFSGGSSGGGAGTKNRLINGSMRTDQRNGGNAQTITRNAALAYTVDRWYAYCTGTTNNVTGQRVQGATAGQFRYRFAGAANTTAIGFGQRIERLNSADLAGTTVTLSADLANSLLTTVTWTAFYANTADAFGTLASPTRTQIATGTWTVNSTVTRYSAQIAVPAAATTGIEIVLSVGAQTSGAWTIGDVQLEAGTVATPFEWRSYGLELALCQRYFEKSYDDWVAVGTATTNGVLGGAVYYYNSGNQKTSTSSSFRVTKRTQPTLTFYDTAGNSGTYSNFINGTTTANYGAITVLGNGCNGFHVYPTNIANSMVYHYTAVAEL